MTVGEIIDAKVRRVGTSLGILIPKEVIDKEKIKEGQEVRISIVKKPSKEDVDKAFGMLKGKKRISFERDKTDRIDRYIAGEY